MSCEDCSNAQAAGHFAPVRWKNANIDVSGCPPHVAEVITVLRDAQRPSVNSLRTLIEECIADLRKTALGELVALVPFPHMADKANLAKVIVRHSGDEYVVWTYNRLNHGFHVGHYCKDFDSAMQVFRAWFFADVPSEDTQALDRIHSILNNPDPLTDTIDAITEIVRESGRK